MTWKQRLRSIGLRRKGGSGSQSCDTLVACGGAMVRRDSVWRAFRERRVTWLQLRVLFGGEAPDSGCLVQQQQRHDQQQ